MEYSEIISYEELYGWRFLVEYHIKHHNLRLPEYSRENGYLPEDFPGDFQYLLDCKEHREKLYNFYHCNLFYWNPAPPKRLMGWYLISKETAFAKIHFLEKVVLLNQDPQKLKKPWLEKELLNRLDSVAKAIDVLERNASIPGNFIPFKELLIKDCQVAKQILRWLDLVPQPRPYDAVLGGKQTGPGPYDAVLGGDRSKWKLINL